MNFQENTKTNRNPQNATLTLVPALLQTGRSTLAPRHSEYSSRSTILNKGLGVGLAIDVSKVKLHFRVNLWPSFWGPKTLAKPVSATEGLPSSRTCVDISVRRVWRTSTRGAAKPWKPSGMETSVAYMKKQSKLVLFSLGDHNFADKTTPVLGSKNGPQNGVHSFSLNLICLCPGDLAPVLGSKNGPRNGGRFCQQNFCRRAKNSASFDCPPRVHDRFCIPLGFHDFAAPRAIVRHALQACMSAHALELGRPSVARPVFAVVFGPQTGAHKNHFFSIP